ncbi:hypothetical protein CRENBAI_013151, partial [Crenichthys baileyi]
VWDSDRLFLPAPGPWGPPSFQANPSPPPPSCQDIKPPGGSRFHAALQDRQNPSPWRTPLPPRP